MISLTTLSADNGNIERCAKALAAGELVAFPTETVYGLGADATNDNAVASIFAAKNRPDFNPLIVHVTDREAAARFVEFNSMADRLAKAFWPGALTLIVAQRDTSPLSQALNPGGNTVALRAPGNDITLRLLRAFAGPLTAPSANLAGAAPPKTAEDVMENMAHAIDAVLDGGPCPGNESTLLDLSADPPRLLRAGAISRRQIEDIVGPLE